MDLHRYERAKLRLADIARSGSMHVRQITGADGEAVRDLFARLAEDRFNLVVVGRFSRGKTSLMNAMLGTDRLPTGIVPVTSVITSVSYGSEEKAVLHYQHTSLFMEIPLRELEDHITERGNPGNRKRIRMAEVQLPAELLRKGFYFIDTPGLGSSIVENTRTTETFLPEADAVVLVTSYDSPLSDEESRTLEAVRRSGRKIFVAVNKQDLVGPDEQRQVLDHLARQLSEVFAERPPPVFSISAQQALAARQHGDPARLQASGMLALERAIIGFLVNERHREFLLNMCARTGAVLSGHAGAREALQQLEALRAEVAADGPAVVETDLRADGTLDVSPALPPCEMCACVAEAVFNFLAQYQFQLHGNRAVQADLAARHGLCGPHTWQFEKLAAPREVCTGFAGVLERQAAHLRAAARADPDPDLACQAVDAMLPTAGSCPVCEIARRAEAAALGDVARRLSQGTAHLQRLSRICLPHLRGLLASLRNPALARDVLLRHSELLDRLAEDMRRFALKKDATRGYLASAEETTAARRATRIMAGDPNAQTGPPARGDPANVARLGRRG